jgi:hypothetical protein
MNASAEEGTSSRGAFERALAQYRYARAITTRSRTPAWATERLSHVSLAPVSHGADAGAATRA